MTPFLIIVTQYQILYIMLQKQSAICIVICNLQVYNKYQNRRGGIDTVEICRKRCHRCLSLLKQLEAFVNSNGDTNYIDERLVVETIHMYYKDMQFFSGDPNVSVENILKL